MSTSLDRKLEASRQRANAERAARGLTPEQFRSDNHLMDGTVKPSAAPAPAAAAAGAPTARQWLRRDYGWYEAANPHLIHRTRDQLPPQADMGNVIETLDSVVGTHVPETVPGAVVKPELGLHPKPQRMWVRDGLDWVDDNEDKCAFYFTRDGEQPTEDMANVDSIRTVKTITPMQAMAAVVNFAQNDIDIARSWHDEVVACVMEHFGDTRANADVRARAVAKVFMGRVFGISPESELFAKREELRLESEPIGPQPFPFMGSPDAADALAYGMEAWKHRAQQASGMSAQALLHRREPGKSWLTMELFREMQRALNARQLLLINELMTHRPAPIVVHMKDIEQRTLDQLMTGVSVTQGGKRIDPASVRPPLDELPSGNFGQRPERWGAMSLEEWLVAVHGPSTPESPQATDTPRKD